VSKLDLTDPIALLLAIAKALRAACIDAALYGGLALAAYGEPRETKDADLAVTSADSARVVAALERDGLDVSVKFERMRFGGHLITRIAVLGGERTAELNIADFVEPRSARYAAAVLGSAIKGELREETVSVITPEDFVLFKNLSTRDRDLEDAATVVRALGETLDREVIVDEAGRLAREIEDHDVAGRLARVLTPHA
jgi:hypothetical protein